MNSPFPLSPPQKAIESLLALRDYYAPLVEDYEKLYSLAKANLTHVEALLSNWPLTEKVVEGGRRNNWESIQTPNASSFMPGNPSTGLAPNCKRRVDAGVLDRKFALVTGRGQEAVLPSASCRRSLTR